MECKTETKKNMPVQPKEKLFHQVKEETNDQAFMIPLLGFDNQIQGCNTIENNLTEYDWAIATNIYPNFWGRNAIKDKCFTQEDLKYVRETGTIIAAIYVSPEMKEKETQGRAIAEEIDTVAQKMNVPNNAVIFLEINNECITTEYMLGYIDELSKKGYVPAFKVDTNANYDFVPSFNNGMKGRNEVFAKSKIWFVVPTLEKYERIYFDNYN